VILDANKRVELNYPCKWQYKLIGRFEDLIKEDVKKILNDKEHKIEIANKSKKGKFISLNLHLEVESEEERLSIFDSLCKSQVIMRVL